MPEIEPIIVFALALVLVLFLYFCPSNRAFQIRKVRTKDGVRYRIFDPRTGKPAINPSDGKPYDTYKGSEGYRSRRVAERVLAEVGKRGR